MAMLGEGERFPIFTRPIPKSRKPAYVPGWSHTSDEAKLRYIRNGYRYQAYQI